MHKYVKRPVCSDDPPGDVISASQGLQTARWHATQDEVRFWRLLPATLAALLGAAATGQSNVSNKRDPVLHVSLLVRDLQQPMYARQGGARHSVFWDVHWGRLQAVALVFDVPL